MQAKRCDRCKTYFMPGEEEWLSIDFSDYDIMCFAFPSHSDLCGKCKKLFKIFMNNKTIKGD